MFSYTTFKDNNLEIIEITDNNGTSARFVPARGGFLAEYQAEGVPLFYMDRETLYDSSKNIRGGNPVLFPICGPLEDNTYSLPDGRQFIMKQHGLARNLPWQVWDIQGGPESARITLSLASDASTREAYPFDFRLVFTYIIEVGRLTVKQEYHNDSPDAMPFYAGFHPYFLAAGVKASSLHIPAQECFDLKTGRSQEVSPELDFNDLPETNLVYSGLRENQAWFIREDGRRVTVQFDSSFCHVVLWTLQGRDFLCVEPWMGNNYDLNRGQAKLLEPGRCLHAEVVYTIE